MKGIEPAEPALEFSALYLQPRRERSRHEIGFFHLDPVLLETVNITAGLKAGGWIVINTNRDLQDSEMLRKFRVATVDANTIALKYGLGSRSAPIVNTAIVGAFAGATKLIGLKAALEAVEEFVPMRKENNRKAAEEAFYGVNFISK